MNNGWVLVDEPMVLVLEESKIYLRPSKSNAAPALCKHPGTSSARGQMLFRIPVSPTYLRSCSWPLMTLPISLGRTFCIQKNTAYTLRPAIFPFLIRLQHHVHGTAPSWATHTTANGSHAAAARHGSRKTRDDTSAIPSNATSRA